jgi:hypothetical protein
MINTYLKKRWWTRTKGAVDTDYSGSLQHIDAGFRCEHKHQSIFVNFEASTHPAYLNNTNLELA